MHLEKLKAKNDRANITYKSEVQKINKEQEHSNNKTNSNAATENSRKNKENTHSTSPSDIHITFLVFIPISNNTQIFYW